MVISAPLKDSTVSHYDCGRTKRRSQALDRMFLTFVESSARAGCLYFHFDEFVQSVSTFLAFSEDERLVVRDAIEDSFELHLVIWIGVG